MSSASGLLLVTVSELWVMSDNVCPVMVRMEPQLAQSLLERARQERLQQAGRVPSGLNRGGGADQEALR